jgi:hypothetical protein
MKRKLNEKINNQKQHNIIPGFQAAKRTETICVFSFFLVYKTKKRSVSPSLSEWKVYCFIIDTLPKSL